MWFKKNSERLYHVNSNEKLVKDSNDIQKKCPRWGFGLLVVAGLLVLSLSTWAILKYVNSGTVDTSQTDFLSGNEMNQTNATEISDDGSGSTNMLVSTVTDLPIPVIDFHTNTQRYETMNLLNIKDHINRMQNKTSLQFVHLENRLAELTGRVDKATQSVNELTQNFTLLKDQTHNLSTLLQSLSFMVSKHHSTLRQEKEENNEKLSNLTRHIARRFSTIAQDFNYKLQNATSTQTHSINETNVNLTEFFNKIIREQIQTVENNFGNEVSLVSDNSRLFCQESLVSEISRLHAVLNSTIQASANRESLDRRKDLTSIRNSLRSQLTQTGILQRRISTTENNLGELDGRIATCENKTSLLRLQMTKKADAGWIEAPNGYAYKVIRRTMSWHQGRSECEAQGGTLAYVGLRSSHGGQMHDYIFRNVVQPLGGTLTYSVSRPPVNVWIGLNDIDSEFSWKWLDGKALLPAESHWFHRKPYHVHLDCAELQIQQGSWKDYRCSEPRTNYALCEKKVVD